MSLKIGYVALRSIKLVFLDQLPTYEPFSQRTKVENEQSLSQPNDISDLGGVHDTSSTTLTNLYQQLDRSENKYISINQFKSCLIYFGINLSDSKYWKFIDEYTVNVESKRSSSPANVSSLTKSQVKNGSMSTDALGINSLDRGVNRSSLNKSIANNIIANHVTLNESILDRNKIRKNLYDQSRFESSMIQVTQNSETIKRTIKTKKKISKLNEPILDYDNFCVLLRKVLLMNFFRKSVVQQSSHKSSLSKISYISISEDKVFLKDGIKDHRQFFFNPLPSWSSINWINITDADSITMKRLGIYFNLSKLTIDNCLNTRLHTRIEVNNDYIVVSLPHFSRCDSVPGKIFDVNAIKILVMKKHFAGKDTLVSLSNINFKKTKLLLNQKFSNIRKSPLFILYHLINEVFDSTKPIVNLISDEISKHEGYLVSDIKSIDVNHISNLKLSINTFKKTLKPVREMLTELIKLFPQYSLFYDDILNQSNSIIDDLNELLDSNKGILDQYNLIKANILNEVMYVLAGVTTVFAPCQFLTSVYGMNFSYMPELSYKYGYLIFWMVSLTIFIGGSLIFKTLSHKFGL